MKIFFTGSPRALEEDQLAHQEIYNLIEKFGHINLSDLVFKADPKTFYLQDYEQRKQHYRKTLRCLLDSDVLICEISLPSISMGFLIAKALEIGKPVIALHKPTSEPFFLTGIWNDKFQIIEYKSNTIDMVLFNAIKIAKSTLETRFNFLLDSHLHSYLNFLSQRSSQPKAVIVRDLIKDTMLSDDEFLDQEAGFTQFTYDF